MLFGRKIVLKPLPVQVPMKADKGPSGAGSTTAVGKVAVAAVAATAGRLKSISRILKSRGAENTPDRAEESVMTMPFDDNGLDVRRSTGAPHRNSSQNEITYNF